MPPTSDREQRRQKNINQSVIFPIVNNSAPTPNIFLSPEIIEEKNLRRINREARMKENQERRNNNRNNIRPAPILPPRPPRPPRPIKIISNTPDPIKLDIPIKTDNNIINPPIIPVIPPLFTDYKNTDIIIPSNNNSKIDESTTIQSATITKDNKNLYLIGGTALVAFLVIAMNKR